MTSALILGLAGLELTPDERAFFAELQPWVEQWHSELDPTFGVSPAQFAREQLSEHLMSLGLTVDDLAAWRPPAPTRGRRAAK